MKFRRTTKIGEPRIAAGLKAARIAAGYKSGRAAALAHGWAESTFKAHESATRAISESDAAVYEQAFGIPEGVLLREPESLPLAEEEADPELIMAAEREARERAGLRLRLARYLRGFKSASDAARHFSMKRATLAAHEGGANMMSPLTAEMYAEAFAVNPHWLIDGRFPSRLGSQVDANLARRGLHSWDEHEANHFIHMVERANLAPPTRIAVLLEDLRKHPAKLAGKGQDAVFEFSPLEAYARRTTSVPDGVDWRGNRCWTLPDGLLSKAFGAASVTNVMVVVVDKAAGPFRVGDRLFVDVSQTDVLVPGRYCGVNASGDLDIAEGGADSNGAGSSLLLGRIIAAFCGE